MKKEAANIDMELIAFLQGDMPAVSRPYRELAVKCGCTEQQVVELIQAWLAEGRIRRMAGVLRHQQAGYNVNAMIAWRVADDRADELGCLMSSYPQVSHCYLRSEDERFPYNLYTMVHSRSREELDGIIASMKLASGVDDCQVLVTARELKKTSMQYV